MSYTVQLTFDTPASIPIQLGKWLAICEMHRDAVDIKSWRSDSRVCQPRSIQVLSNGSLRLIFSIWYERNLRRINFAKTPWIELCEDPFGSEVVVHKQVPSWVDGVGEMGAELKAVEVVVGLAELLLTCLETIKTVGCTDRDTLRDCFAHDMNRMPPGSLAWPEQRPCFRTLNDGQVASILDLAEQWRQRMSAAQFTMAAPPQPSLLQERVDKLNAEEKLKLEHAKAMEEARKRVTRRNESLQRRLAEAKEETQRCLIAYTNAYRDVRDTPPHQRSADLLKAEASASARLQRMKSSEQEIVEQLAKDAAPAPPAPAPPPPPPPPPSLRPLLLPPPPPPISGCVDACLPERDASRPVRVLQRDPDAPPVAMVGMAFTCNSVEDVPVMVAKLMAVCTSSKVEPGQIKPYQLQILDGGSRDAFAARVLMYVHRLIVDDVQRVPDWALPHPCKSESADARVVLKVPLPDWDESGIAAPLAHSVHLAALLHAWFERCAKAATKRCRKFLQITSGPNAEELALTEEQQHILLELSEEYLTLLRDEWRNAPAERTESPKNVEATEFPKLGASPKKDVSSGRTTYMQSMFAITKPAMREPDLKQLSKVTYLSPYRRDMIWSSGPKAALGWGVYTGTPRRIAAW